MKPENFLQTLTLFFNDIIGAIIPGSVFLVGLLIIHVGPIEKNQLEVPSVVLVAVVFFTFAAGHFLLSIYSKCIEPNLVRLGAFKYAKMLRIKSTSNIQLEVEQSKAYITFRAAASERVVSQGGSKSTSMVDWNFNEIRNLAMSINSEASAVARRFMCIALLCSGVGAAFVILALDFLVATYFFPNAVAHYHEAPGVVVQVVLLFTVAWFCFARGAEFFRRALSAPFSVAYAVLYFGDKKEKKDGKD